jgi:hypothetical protein
MSFLPTIEYFAPGQENLPYWHDAAPSVTDYSEYYTPGQEDLPLVYEATAPRMIPLLDDDGVGLGIMVPSYSGYYDASSTSDTYQSEVLPPPLSLAEPDSTLAVRPSWLGRYSHLGDFNVFEDSPECEESEVEAEIPVWAGDYLSSDSYLLDPPPRSPIDPRYLDENDSMTSLFHVDEGWEERLINSYVTDADEEEEEEECKFDYNASFFSTVFNGANPQPRTSKKSYYEHEHENTDSMPWGANSKPKANLVDSFRDEYFSRCCIQVQSVNSGNVCHVLRAAKVAQVAEVAHINELIPRGSGGSLVQRCPKKVISLRRYSQLLKHAVRKGIMRAKQRLSQ